MNDNRKPRSLPEIQISRFGTKGTYDAILSVATNLSYRDLLVFEDEIEFYERTGLVGLQMSMLLVRLEVSANASAA